MSTKLKLCFVALFVLAVLVARVLGDYAAVWKDGGEQGVVNLPLCASTSSMPGPTTRIYDYGYRMQSVSHGACLVLPSNMRACVFTLSYSGVVVSTQTAKDKIRVLGSDLAYLRDHGIRRFEMSMFDGTKRLDILFVLHTGDDPYEIYVKCN